ncbi:hypothetical protein EGW08_000935 [Elysia chlorotica]|uniref:Neurotransmitter-gated ion-channel ligand-binding domain-containing protein n=1 Tax=Elysia chlorotica TaxID=188477 RepID=A0A3S1A0I2_ELYCH|nr:hypothetical protein EGW08_000935 [Elysia chlorotica]
MKTKTMIPASLEMRNPNDESWNTQVHQLPLFSINISRPRSAQPTFPNSTTGQPRVFPHRHSDPDPDDGAGGAVGNLLEMDDEKEMFESSEHRLMRHLVGQYDNSVRPVFDANDPVDIRLGLTLTQILDLEWYDQRLNWSASDFDGVASIRIPCNKLWLPDIVLYNSNVKLVTLYKGNVKFVVLYKGNVKFVVLYKGNVKFVVLYKGNVKFVVLYKGNVKFVVLYKGNVKFVVLYKGNVKFVVLYKGNVKFVVLYKGNVKFVVLYKGNVKFVVLYKGNVKFVVLYKGNVKVVVLYKGNVKFVVLYKGNIKFVVLYEGNVKFVVLYKGNVKFVVLYKGTVEFVVLYKGNVKVVVLYKGNVKFVVPYKGNVKFVVLYKCNVKVVVLYKGNVKFVVLYKGNVKFVVLYKGYMPSLAMVYNTSRVFWGPVIRFRSSCQIDITFFPFDTQVCKLKMGSWAYTGLQVRLGVALDCDNSTYNTSVGVKRNVVFYNCCDEPFPDVTFSIQLRRRTKYYFMNIIIPCIILSFLCLGGFLLPPESGEKITLGLSVLLTITVFMLMVADKMPQTSESISVISIYLMVVLATSCLSVLSSVLVLSIHHQRGRPSRAPLWLRRLCFSLVARLLHLVQVGLLIVRHDLAFVLDRLLFYLFFLVTLVSTVGILEMRPKFETPTLKNLGRQSRHRIRKKSALKAMLLTSHAATVTVEVQTELAADWRLITPQDDVALPTAALVDT